MILRFYLQSGEFKFFMRRLKNVAITKMSLKQLKQNETMMTNKGPDKYLFDQSYPPSYYDNKKQEVSFSYQKSSKSTSALQTP